MREYEFTFVVQPEISEEGIHSICERFEDTLAKGGGEKLFYEDWGRRRLAYEIRRFQKGHYLVLHFLSEGQVIAELERAARIDDSILRFLTVVADEEVADIAKRKTEGAALEEERAKRAAEKAARDAEEAAAREAEAARTQEAEAAQAAAGADEPSEAEAESETEPETPAQPAEQSV